MFGKTQYGWIGVDLGGRAVKLAQLRRTKGRICLSAAAVESGRSGAEAGDLTERLRTVTALAEHSRGSSAAASLSMAECEVQPVDDESPVEEDRCYDSWVVDRDSAYTLSADAGRIESAVSDFTKVGLQCEVIDGPPLVIARALELVADYDPSALLGALDWGESAVTFVAATGGQARYVRRLKGGGFGGVRDQVAGALGMTPAEAERAIDRYGVAEEPLASDKASSKSLKLPVVSAEARTVSNALVTALRPTIKELQRTLEHLGGKLKCRGPERLYVMGTGGTVAGLPYAVESAIHRPVEPWQTEGLDRDQSVANLPDCLLAQAIALSALAWESGE